MRDRGTNRDEFGRDHRLAQIGKPESAAQMERRLVGLRDQFIKTRDPRLREQYRALHARWMEAME